MPNLGSVLAYVLGGTQGLGQGIDRQNQLDLQRGAQDLEKSKLRADLITQGFLPDLPGSPASSGPSMTTPAMPSPQAPPGPSGPQAVLPQVMPVQPMRRSRDGFVSTGPTPSPAPPPNTPSASPTPGSSGTPFDLSALMATNGQSVNMPGVGNFTYNFNRSPLARQAILNAIERQSAADQAIRQAQATGETDKNAADAALARRNANVPKLGDPGYASAMGDVASAEAAARLPADIQKAVAEGRITRENAIAVEGVRANVQRELQKNQQDFERGNITIQHKNALDEQAQRLAGDFANSLGLKNYDISGHPVQMASHAMFGKPAPTTAPSALPSLTPAQVSRASSDPSYRQFLTSKGYTFQ